MVTMFVSTATSMISSVVEGSNDFVVGAVNSDDRRNPKNARVKAAHNMSLSTFEIDKLFT